jgi:hypothetical protein
MTINVKMIPMNEIIPNVLILVETSSQVDEDDPFPIGWLDPDSLLEMSFCIYEPNLVMD